jgi:hypothetical protein
MSLSGYDKVHRYVHIFVEQWAEGIQLPARVNPARMPILSERVFECMQLCLSKVLDYHLYSTCLGVYELLVEYYELLGERSLSADCFHEEVLQTVYNDATAFRRQSTKLTHEERRLASSVGPRYTAAFHVAKEVIQCSIS